MRRLKRTLAGLPPVRALVVALLLVGLAGALAHEGDEERPASQAVPEAGGGGEQKSKRSFLSLLIPPPPEQGNSVPSRITDLLNRLPLERKVAQLFLVGFSGRDTDSPVFRELRRRDLGGIVLESRNYEDPDQLSALTGKAREVARSERHVPPWVMAAQEGGEFSQFGDLPPQAAPGELASIREASAEALAAGRALRRRGVNGVLAPVLDVRPEDGGVLGPRAYSNDPKAVAAYAAATVRGYEEGLVMPAAKHFPGLGAAAQSTDDGPTSIGLSQAELERRDLVPFRAAIRARVPAIVLSNGLYSTDDFLAPASLSPGIATKLLRQRLGFEGMTITGDLAEPAVTAATAAPDAAVEALKAGADMVYISGPEGDQEGAYTAALNAVRKGELPRERVEEALLQVLAAKLSFRLIR